MSKKRVEWERRLKEWESSGETQVEFCRRYNVTPATFKYWRKVIGRTESEQGRSSFVPIGGSDAIELEVEGTKLRLPSSTPASWVAELISCFR